MRDSIDSPSAQIETASSWKAKLAIGSFVGSAVLLGAAHNAQAAEISPDGQNITIEAGDNLIAVTKALHPEATNQEILNFVDDVARINNLKNANRVFRGQQLQLPATQAVEPPAILSPLTIENPAITSAAQTELTITKGDTMWRQATIIAKATNITTIQALADIQTANPGLDPLKLQVGGKLVLPVAPETYEQAKTGYQQFLGSLKESKNQAAATAPAASPMPLPAPQAADIQPAPTAEVSQPPVNYEAVPSIAGIPQEKIADSVEHLIAKHDFSPQGAAYLVASGMQESGLRTGHDVAGDGGTAHGIFQWRGGRLNGLDDNSDLPIQLDYAVMEMQRDTISNNHHVLETLQDPNATPEQLEKAIGYFERYAEYNLADKKKPAGEGNRFTWGSQIASALETARPMPEPSPAGEPAVSVVEPAPAAPEITTPPAPETVVAPPVESTVEPAPVSAPEVITPPDAAIPPTPEPMAPEPTAPEPIIQTPIETIPQASETTVPAVMETPPTTEVAIPNNVYILGDSLTQGLISFGGLADKLAAKGIVDIDISARCGRHVAKDGANCDGEDHSDLSSGLDQLDKNKDQDFIKQATTVVVELGTNDTSDHQFEDHARQLAAKIKAINPEVKIAWVNFFSTDDHAPAFQKMNDILNKLAREGAITSVIDWASQAPAYYEPNAAHPGEHYGDMAAYVISQLGE